MVCHNHCKSNQVDNLIYRPEVEGLIGTFTDMNPSTSHESGGFYNHRRADLGCMADGGLFFKEVSELAHKLSIIVMLLYTSCFACPCLMALLICAINCQPA